MKMRKLITICAVVTMILAVSGVAQAGVTAYTYDVGPGDLAGGGAFDNGQGGEPFGYDHDQAPPIGVDVAGPAGFGDSCFWSNVQGTAAGGGRDYTSLRLSPKDIFGVTDVTVAQLSKISYLTKQQFDTSNPDMDMAWQIKIYTEGDPGNWYGVKIELTKPLYNDNNWNLNSTDDNLSVYKTVIKDSGFGTLSAGTSFAAMIAEYSSEKIMFIDVVAGWNSSSPPVYSYLDGVKLELTTGDTATMNLVPEPATMALFGLGGLLLRRRKSA